jgi:hypothetical protein
MTWLDAYAEYIASDRRRMMRLLGLYTLAVFVCGFAVGYPLFERSGYVTGIRDTAANCETWK